MTKLKAFADYKLNEAQMMISVFDRVENILGKGQNVGNQHFLLFLKCFQNSSTGVGWVGGSLTHSHTMTPFDAPGKQAF